MDDALRSTQHMKATQTNMEASERETSEQEKDSKYAVNWSPHQTQTQKHLSPT